MENREEIMEILKKDLAPLFELFEQVIMVDKEGHIHLSKEEKSNEH